MTFLKIALTTSMALVFFIGCSKTGSEGISPEGHCTEATIEANNIIVSVFEKKDGTEVFTQDIEKLRAADAQCTRFVNLVGGDSCQAIDPKTGSAITITATKNQAVCEMIRNALTPGGGSVDQISPPTPGSNTSLATSADARPLRWFNNGILLNLKDLAFNAQPIFFLQTGKILTTFKKLSPSKNYCKVTVGKRLAIERDLPMSLQFPDPGQVNLVNSARGAKFECFKRSSPAQWTVEDLKGVFGGLSSIQALP